jgi:macrodomain Ter protein organizer (MatP/YcbG family)
MQRYSNFSGNAGVQAYQAGSNYIDVQFDDGAIYRYTYSSASKEAVEEMQRLAEAGKGLTTYINRYVKEAYAAKLK